MHLFKNYPIISYDLHKNNLPLEMMDLTAGFSIKQFLTERQAIYYRHQITPSDTPESIAHNYYDDSRLDWIIILVNQMIDPHWEWPKSQPLLDKYVKNKYGSTAAARETVHQYMQRITDHQVLTDGTIVKEKWINIDLKTYNTVSSTHKKIKTKYEYEDEENEKLREISILDTEFVPEVIAQVRTVFE